MLSRRQFLHTGAAAAAAVALAPRPAAADPAQPAARPPNLILVMADDLSARDLGCYGSTDHATPHLDAMAAQGTAFRTCWATPICVPSRVQLFTGRYGFRTGFFHNRLQPQDRAQRAFARHHLTFPQHLQAAGYATAMVGKWQVHASKPPAVGFDEAHLFEDHPDYPGPRRVEGKPDHWPFNNPSFYWFPSVTHNGQHVPTTPRDFGPDLSLRFCLDFARRHRDRPFLIHWALNLPHTGWIYEDHRPGLPRCPGPDGQRLEPTFPNAVACLDRLLGQLQQGIRDAGLADHTIILFTADNATETGGKNRFEQEQGPRVPLIVTGPPRHVAPRGLTDALTDFSDVLPTLADWSGRPLQHDYALDGRSFAPVLRGDDAARRAWIFSYLWDRRFLRDERFLLDGHGQLWDTHGRRDEQGYTDVTDSADPPVAAARARFTQLLEALPPPPPEQIEAALRDPRTGLPGRVPAGVAPAPEGE